MPGFQQHGWLTVERLMTEIAVAGASLTGSDHGCGAGVEGWKIGYKVEVAVGGHRETSSGFYGSAGLCVQ